MLIAALIILSAIVIVGTTLWLIEQRYRRRHPEAPAAVEPEQQCCGMHVTCERDSLLTSVSTEIEYFDDEELDAFKGRRPDSYTAEESEQFRDVLLTLLPDDIAPWARSLGLRGIEMPADVREELLLIVSEARAARATHPTADAPTA